MNTSDLVPVAATHNHNIALTGDTISYVKIQTNINEEIAVSWQRDLLLWSNSANHWATVIVWGLIRLNNLLFLYTGEIFGFDNAFLWFSTTCVFIV